MASSLCCAPSRLWMAVLYVAVDDCWKVGGGVLTFTHLSLLAGRGPGGSRRVRRDQPDGLVQSGVPVARLLPAAAAARDRSGPVGSMRSRAAGTACACA